MPARSDNQPVDLAGERGGDRRLGRVAGGRHLGGGSRGVGGDHRQQSQLADQPPALRQALDVAAHRLQPADRRPGQR